MERKIIGKKKKKIRKEKIKGEKEDFHLIA